MSALSAFLAVASALLLLAGGAVAGTCSVLALVGLLRPGRGRRAASEEPPRHAFAIVIPAHDEEASLGRTLASCRALEYPADLRTVYVVADNCTDGTAEVARGGGAVCLTRVDPARRGKGHALEFAFARIDLERHDAVLVLDADCEIDAHALRLFDRRLAQGSLALQANNVASNPDDSPTSYLLAVGNRLENELTYAPRAALGWTVLLRGTGMVLHRDLLRRFPWRAHSIAEDVEYSLELVRGGVPVGFVREAAVRSPFPADATQLRVQRARWAGGNLRLARGQALRWMLAGLRHRRAAWFEAGWTLLLLSRPLVLLVALLALLFAAAAALVSPEGRAPVPLAIAALPAALLAATVALGIVHLGLTPRRLRLLLGTPVVAARLVAIAIAGLFRRGAGVWARTPRAGNADPGGGA